jgi:hypothetical protein
MHLETTPTCAREDIMELVKMEREILFAATAPANVAGLEEL